MAVLSQDGISLRCSTDDANITTTANVAVTAVTRCHYASTAKVLMPLRLRVVPSFRDDKRHFICSQRCWGRDDALPAGNVNLQMTLLRRPFCRTARMQCFRVSLRRGEHDDDDDDADDADNGDDEGDDHARLRDTHMSRLARRVFFLRPPL